jgi:hypothetical protein
LGGSFFGLEENYMMLSEYSNCIQRQEGRTDSVYRHIENGKQWYLDTKETVISVIVE